MMVIHTAAADNTSVAFFHKGLWKRCRKAKKTVVVRLGYLCAGVEKNGKSL